MNTCLAIPLGLLDYQAAYDLQRRLHAQVVAGELPDLLLLLEHPHVYTLGRRGQQSHILASDEALIRNSALRRTSQTGAARRHTTVPVSLSATQSSTCVVGVAASASMCRPWNRR